MRKLTIASILVFGFMLAAGNAFGYSFGNEITVSDQNIDTSNTWYTGEDQEVEPGMQTNQGWDLEGFFMDGSILTMIGGYDFVNGYGDTTSGDIFLDIDGDAEFGDTHDWTVNDNEIVTNTYGYDYVLDMDFEGKTYDIYQLDADSRTLTPYVAQNQGSNPWQYYDGGTLLAENVSFDYMTGLTDADTGFAGGSHNVVTGIDLSFIASDIPVDFIAHFTMACGNDNLMGQGTLAANTPPSTTGTPEPATMFLLGSGIAGLVVRRKSKKN